jgi:LysR family glycine cleavage system transcriptional activator
LPEPRGALEFNDPGLMLQAAADGQGIALARGSIVAEDLGRGNLVRLFSIAVPADSANYVAWPSRVPPPPKVLAFRDWLLAEVGADASVRAVTGPRLGGDLVERRVRRNDLRIAG